MIVNRRQFADFVGVSERVVGRWVAQGMPVRRQGGKGRALEIESSDAVGWMIEQHLTAELGERTGSADDTAPMSEHRAALLQQQTRKLRLANQKTEGDLVPADQVQSTFTEVATIYATQLDSLAGRLAAGNAVERQRVFDECRRIRTETADSLQALVDALERRGSGEAAAEADAVGVGGGEAPAAEGSG
ncbi:MAG: terminase small subunit [Pseudomonadales bacterium]